MKKTNLVISALAGIFFCGASLALASDTDSSVKGVGGVTFTGQRDGHCVQISGNDIEKIEFELKTCDEMGQERDEYRNKINFTLFVPEGTHKFKLLKDGETLFMKAITIKPEKTLTITLPEGIEK